MGRKGKKGREGSEEENETEGGRIRLKRSKLVERSPRKSVESESEAEDGEKELIMVLKELKNELNQEMAELRKEVKDMKE